jgi:hypothetical protein
MNSRRGLARPYASANPGDNASLKQAAFALHRQDQAHRRHMSALGVLATYRKLMGTRAATPLPSLLRPGCLRIRLLSEERGSAEQEDHHHASQFDIPYGPRGPETIACNRSYAHVRRS